MESLKSFLTRIAAFSEKTPLIVTIARKRPAHLLGDVFGRQRACCIVLSPAGLVRDAVFAAANPDFPAVPQQGSMAQIAEIFRAASHFQILLRFVDSETATHVVATTPAILEHSQFAICDFPSPALAPRDRETLARMGFESTNVAGDDGRPITAFFRPVGEPPAFAVSPGENFAQLRTLVIVDNNLVGAKGHNLSLAKTITHGAQALGISMVWGANKSFDDTLAPDGIALEKPFEGSHFESFPEQAGNRDFSQALVRGWKDLARKYDSPQTHYLIHSADGHHFRAASQFLDEAPDIAGTIHLCTHYETRSMPSRNLDREIDRHIHVLTRHRNFRRTLFLWAETERLAALYSARLGVPVAPLVLPAPEWSADAPRLTSRPKLALCFLGAARIDKGFQELPGIFGALLSDTDLRDRLRIVVQVAPPTKGFSPVIAGAVEKISAMPSVELVHGTLSERDYRNLLFDADAVLLPYVRDDYATRGSGIFVEALACGRFVLATANIEITAGGHGEPVFPCDSPEDWVNAIRTILADRTDCSGRAWAFGHRYRSEHAPEAYVRRLATRC